MEQSRKAGLLPIVSAQAGFQSITACSEKATLAWCGEDGVLTIHELVDRCVRLQPVLAAQRENSDLAVSPLITELLVDGQVVRLALVDGKWGAGYVRVSDEMQRSAKSSASLGEFLSTGYGLDCVIFSHRARH